MSFVPMGLVLVYLFMFVTVYCMLVVFYSCLLVNND